MCWAVRSWPALLSVAAHGIALVPAGPYVPKVALYQFFDWRWITFRSFTGWMLATANFCSAIGAAVALRIVVRQATLEECTKEPQGACSHPVAPQHHALIAVLIGDCSGLIGFLTLDCSPAGGASQEVPRLCSHPVFPALCGGVHVQWFPFGSSVVSSMDNCFACSDVAPGRLVINRRRRCAPAFHHLSQRAALLNCCRWLVNGTGLAVTAVLGEYLCMQKEMQDIPISSIRRPDRQRSNGIPAVTELAAVAVRK
jgi:hypothetical protein